MLKVAILDDYQNVAQQFVDLESGNLATTDQAKALKSGIKGGTIGFTDPMEANKAKIYVGSKHRYATGVKNEGSVGQKQIVDIFKKAGVKMRADKRSEQDKMDLEVAKLAASNRGKE